MASFVQSSLEHALTSRPRSGPSSYARAGLLRRHQMQTRNATGLFDAEWRKHLWQKGPFLIRLSPCSFLLDPSGPLPLMQMQTPQCRWRKHSATFAWARKIIADCHAILHVSSFLPIAQACSRHSFHAHLPRKRLNFTCHVPHAFAILSCPHRSCVLSRAAPEAAA